MDAGSSDVCSCFFTHSAVMLFSGLSGMSSSLVPAWMLSWLAVPTIFPVTLQAEKHLKFKEAESSSVLHFGINGFHQLTVLRLLGLSRRSNRKCSTPLFCWETSELVCVLWQGHLKGCDPRYGISNQNCCFIMELLFLSWTPWMRKRVSIRPRGPRHPKQEVRDRLCVCVLHIRLQQGCCCLYLLGTEIVGAVWTRGASGLGTVMVFPLQVVGELLSQESLRCCSRVRDRWTGG